MLFLWVAATFAFLGTLAAGESVLSAGGSGWALRFDGVNDFVLLEEDLPAEPWTIEMWVKPESLTNGDGTSLVTFQKKGTLLSRTSMVGGDRILQVCYNGEEVWYTNTNQDGVTSDEVTPSSSAGQLYHFALAKTVNSSRVFLNGVMVSEVALGESDYADISDLISSPWFLGARMALVGRKWVTDDRNFGGVLDEVRWWKGERTAAQLQEYMHRPVPSTNSDLVKQWSFNKEDGDSVVGSYHLGGGNDFNAPSWIPSPVTSHGGSVAISTRATASATTVPVCAILTPAEAGASATLTITGSTTLGTLTPTVSSMTETTEGAPAGSTRFCSEIIFSPAAAGFEDVEFEVRVLLSDGVTELISEQNISISSVGNTPPTAGAAMAVATDGIETYLSLGSWEMADDWSISLWLDPISYVDDVYILSQHYSAGGNLFLFGFFGSGYRLRMSCFAGCSETASLARSYPSITGDVLVLDSGRTADEIEIRKMEPHHLALTFHCVTRGDETTSPLGILKVYQDGLLIGEDEWPICMHKPLLPGAYSDADWAVRPAPWEMGEEYDGGAMNGHLEGVAVVPSNFMHSIYDEFVVWNATLSDAEVLSNAQGTLVRSGDINVRYSFDLDDKAECLERQLWDKTLRCFGLNEASGNTAPSTAFPWTNSPIGDLDRLPSPFYKVAGSPVYKTFAAGTCGTVTLQGADADGDSLTFRLVASTLASATQNVTLDGSSLTLCESDAGLTTTQQLTFFFDACDPFGACAVSTSALGTANFHILPEGPSIVALQALTKDRVLRIIFSAATNCPTVTESAHLAALFTLSDSTVSMRAGDWEEGCQALRVTLDNSSRLFDAAAENLRATVLFAGMLRDAAELSYPSTATSPSLTTLTCGDGELLLPGVVECTMCPSGYVPGENAITKIDECQPCALGTAGVGECAPCTAGTFSSTIAQTECQQCPLGHSCSETGMEAPSACGAGFYQGEVGQSVCLRCPRGQYSSSSGSSHCTACPADKTTQGIGFSSESDCECPEDYYASGDKCLECGKGAVCAGYGAEPKAADGYQLFSVGVDRLEIYSCSAEPLRCPGGVVGACAEGRQGIACAECEDGRTPASDGSCSECRGEDLAVFIVVLSIIVSALLFLYYRTSKHDTIRMKHEALLALTTTAQILFFLQISAVMGRLSIEWPEPLRSFFQFFLVFTFDLNILRMGCVATMSELSVYLMKLAVIPTFVIALTLVHSVDCFIRGKSLLSQKHALLGSIGIFVTSLYAALTSAISSPFQCSHHPSDRWSMKASQGVICWEGGEHVTMIICATLALSILFAFFAWVVRLIQMYPKRMAEGDVRFLNTYSFLFLRVRPAARWYVVMFLARNGVIALIPAIPNAFWQAFAMIFTFGISAGTTLYVMPWKLMPANYYEIFTCVAFQANVVVAIPFVASTEDVNILPEVALGFVLLCFAAAPLMLLRWFVIRVTSHQKAYRWFLCHQKASAGAFARMLKVFLVEKYDRGVFLDSDDLVDLSKLFRYIECDTEFLVPLCTKEILFSPWCLGEIAVSTLHHIQISPVYFPGFCPPADNFIADVSLHVPMTVLTESGLSLEDVQDGLRNLCLCPYSEIPTFFDEVTILQLMGKLSDTEGRSSGLRASIASGLRRGNSVNSNKSAVSQRSSSKLSTMKSGNSNSWASGTHAICLDSAQSEAVATGLVLIKMLRPLLAGNGNLYIPRIDDTDATLAWSKNTEVAIVLCTSGCFSSSRFLYGLLLLVQNEVNLVLPVVALNNFMFPNDTFYEELEGHVAQICNEAGVDEIRGVLTPFTRALFQKIFSRFNIQDSLTILETQADLICRRLLKNFALRTDYFAEEVISSKHVLNDLLTDFQTREKSDKAKSDSSSLTASTCEPPKAPVVKKKSSTPVTIKEEANEIIHHPERDNQGSFESHFQKMLVTVEEANEIVHPPDQNLGSPRPQARLQSMQDMCVVSLT